MLDRVVRLAFWTASVICIIDLNDLIRMWIGVERAFSVPLLLCCLVMLAGLLRVRLTDALGWPGLLVLAALASYCCLGIVVAIVSGTDAEADSLWYLVRHLNSFLLILGTAVGGRVLLEGVGAERALQGFLVVITASCIVTLASPWLVDIFLLPPPDGDYRYFGAFSDPNMAALVACFGVVSALALVRAGRHHVLAYGALFASVTALVGTFSRTALVALPFLLAGALLSSRGVQRMRLAVGLALVGAIVAMGSRNLDPTALEERQLARWESLVEVVELSSVDDVSLAGRVTLWNLALDQALDAPWLGHGLGRLHHLDGAWYNDEGVLLGAHNQYLILMGEAGVVPLLLFVAYLGMVLRVGFGARSTIPILAAVSGWTVVLTLFSIAFHGILTQRACNVVIGFSCAAVASYSGRARYPETRTIASTGNT